MSAFVYRACARDTRSWDTLAWPGFIRYLPAQRQIKNYTSNYPARYRKPNAVYHLPITRPTDSESRLFPPTWLVTVSRRNSIVNCRKIDWEKCFCSFRIFASFVRPLDSSRSGDTSSRNSIIEPTTRNSPTVYQTWFNIRARPECFIPIVRNFARSDAPTHAAHPSRPLDRW